MRIGLITEKYFPDQGGVAVSSQRLAAGLAKSGYSVRVIVPSADRSELSETVNGIDVFRFSIYKKNEDTSAELLSTLQRFHAEKPFDLLHAYFISHAAFVAVYAARLLNIPVIVSARGNDLDRGIFDGARTAQILYALQYATAVTANSSELIRKIAALSGREDAVLIPNAIDTGVFRPAPAPAALKEKFAGKFAIGFSGEARRKKGLTHLLFSFKKIAEEHPAALLMVGPVRAGEDRETLDVFVRQNPHLLIELIPRVKHPEMPHYYGAMDVMVMPSLRDGMPNAVLEAMACARAVVASDVGGIPDIITHMNDGFLVKPADVEALVAAIRQLLLDDALRAQIGENARSNISSRFGTGAELEENLRLYRKLTRTDVL